MDEPAVLWVDFTAGLCRTEFFQHCGARCHIHRITHTGLQLDAIRVLAPRIICFDYDTPSEFGLTRLQATKTQYPSLPILMLTRDHSERLAVWALRNRVWDYLVKPVTADEFLGRVYALLQLAPPLDGGLGERRMKRPDALPVGEMTLGGKVTQRAVFFIDAHYAEHIALEDVARVCGLGVFQFSRQFRHEQGVTFREFLLQRRVGKSMQLLRNSNSPVTDVALGVGFHDASYFTRMFRRYVGVTPSRYRLDVCAMAMRHSGKNLNKKQQSEES